MTPTRTTPSLLLGAAAALALAASASAQLTEPEVLLVYDSRSAASKEIAEYYAGSAKVPGGAGGIAGVHPRVNVLDISSRPSTQAGTTPPPAGVWPQTFDSSYGLTYTEFKTQLRDPLRAYLWSSGLTRKVRCLLLTTGIPHRIRDMGTYPQIGDDPGSASNFPFNLTYASVDSELTLLFQSLDAGEAGAIADSRADGGIKNPLWGKQTPVAGWSNRYNTETKAFVLPGGGANGLYWLNGADQNAPTTLTPGDMYLVCRLDGNSAADVKAMIDRAQNLVVPTATARFILDNDGNGFDNQGPTDLNAGPDFSQTSAALTGPDTRYVAAKVTYDNLGGVTRFFVGPRVDYSSVGSPQVVTDPLLLIASLGANHSGVGNGSLLGTTYATSFNYLPGAAFNTLESYNGRNLNGLTGGLGQQQVADAVGAGVTFAIGNVWEPFALSVADNVMLVRNFYNGDMTWAEAAYSALPLISWQQIVVGDPLARVKRDRDDINADGKFTIDDAYAWYASPVDVNRSGAADNADVRLIELTNRGYEHATMKGQQR